MSSLRTLCLLVLMTTGVQAASAGLTERFAQCAGRMSAEMEFAWLTGKSGDQARLFREHLEILIEAVSEPGDGPRILHTRIEAKLAHATLLTRSMFNDDDRDAAQAARMAAHFANSCRAMLTG